MIDVQEYEFYVFFRFKIHDFYVFFIYEMTYQKVVKVSKRLIINPSK